MWRSLMPSASASSTSLWTDGDALAPASQLRKRDAMHRRRLAHLKFYLRPRRNRLSPAVLAQRGHAENCGLIKAVRLHLHAVSHASRPDGAD
jgi:hypothetical protein